MSWVRSNPKGWWELWKEIATAEPEYDVNNGCEQTKEGKDKN